MNYFCTLFDSNYLTRGLAMYYSLINVKEEFELYIVCFDNLAYDILKSLKLRNVVAIPLYDFENKELLRVKSTRSKGEYCWTCTPHVIRYIIDKYQLPEVTYLDADLYFFNKPSVLLEEFRKSSKDVMITEHRYTREYDQTLTSGIYCVQFMTFKRSTNGLKVLEWWQERCLEWCYAKAEDGKFGDQKYLDDWLERFDSVHVLEHLGGGVAPWNIQQYQIGKGPCVDDAHVIFYHFHAFQWLPGNQYDLGSYKLTSRIIELIYDPYIEMLQNVLQMVQVQYDQQFSKGIRKEKSKWNKFYRNLFRRWKGIYNVISR